MPTLTASELLDVRMNVGSSDTAVLSDTVIQAQYDLATAAAPETALIYPYTYVYLLRRLWGYHRTRVDRTTDHGDRQTRQQTVDNTKALLDYWEGIAGLGDGAGGILQGLSAGVLNLGLDTVDEDG